MTMNAEQDEAVKALELNEALARLERISGRNNLDSQTTVNNAVALLAFERIKLRTTFRYCALGVLALAGCWTVFAFAVIR